MKRKSALQCLFIILMSSLYISGASPAQSDKPEISARRLLENLKNKQFTGSPIEFNLGEADIKTIFNWFEEYTGLDFEVDPDLEIRRFYNFKLAPWDGAIDMILNGCGLELVPDGDILRVVKARPRKNISTAAFLAGICAALSILWLSWLVYRNYHKRKKVRLQEKRISLDDKKIEEVKSSLMYFFDVEKIFRDDSLTLNKLSERLSLMPHQLSWILNVKMGKSFSDLVNHYRIEAMKADLALPKNQERNILDIAFDCGYNSKSAFNKTFKNITGMTPRDFRAQSKSKI